MKYTNHIIIIENDPMQYHFGVERTQPEIVCLEEMGWVVLLGV